LGAPISKLEAVIEVKMEGAIADLRTFDAAEKQVAQSAQQSGAAITQAFQSTSEPIKTASKDVSSFSSTLQKAKDVGRVFASAVKGDFSGVKQAVQSVLGSGVGDTIAAVGTDAAAATQPIAELGSEVAAVGEAGAGAAAALGPVGLAIGAVVVAAVAAATAAVAVGGGLLKLAQEGAELGGRMLDLSNNTGFATESLSLYKIAAEKSGSSVEAVVGAIGRLEKKLQDAASGQKESAELFNAFGINAKQAAENPQAAFDKLAVSIASIEDPALRVKVATELFGESGSKLISTFITMQEEGDGLKSRMAALGLSLSKDVAEGADAVGDEFVILQAVSDSLKIKVANEMGPGIVEALRAIEGAAADLIPVVVKVAGAFSDLFTTTVNGSRVALGSLKGFASGALSGFDAAIAGGIAGGLQAGQKIRDERMAAFNAETNKDAANALAIEEELEARLAGRRTKQQQLDDKLKQMLTKRNAGKPKAEPAEITPVDTVSSTRALRDATLGLEEAKARASIGIAKSEAETKRQILETQYADGLVATRTYFDQRAALESAAIDREIEQQQRVIALEKQRSEDAKADLRAEIERINTLAAAKSAKAKTPGQREAIGEDRNNRLTNVINQAEADKEKRLAKQVEAEGKIAELQEKRAAQVASTNRAELKANEALEKSFSDLILEAQRATGQDFAAAATDIGRKFTDKIALAIREGRPDVVEAIQTLTEVELNKARAAESGKRLDVADAGLAAEQARIQNALNLGIVSEVTARRLQLAAQDKAREAILSELQLEKELAAARGDAVTAARLSVEIERASALGREEDPGVKNLRERLTGDFDSFEKALVYGQKTVGEALRELARSTITSILEQVQQSLVENLTGEKSIGAALAKAISGKLGGLLKVGQQPPVLPGINGQDASKLIITNLKEGSQSVAKSVEGSARKTIESARQAAEKQAQELAKIAQSNLDMAGCACAPPQAPSLLGQVLGAVVGAVGAGVSAGVSSGGGGGGGGYHVSYGRPGSVSAPPTILKRADGGLVSYDEFAGAEGARNGGHVGTSAGRAAIGMMVKGPGGPRDDKVPMWLSDGEYVNDADTVKRLGPDFFKMLPALARAGKMADGGMVGAVVGDTTNNYNYAQRPVILPRSEARAQQPGGGPRGITIVNQFNIQAPRGTVTPETQQQIATRAAMSINAALARNA
jgi:hypothetical protein